ncbi:MAG: PRC-barrel domain-containing protein [Gaiellaceae bacterium]
MLEPGAEVIASGGETVGKLSRVVGDADADVFTGLAIKHGLLSGERLVPSERVKGIWPTRIEVELTKDEVERLPDYEDAPAVRFEPGFSSLFRRLFGRG